MKPSQSKEFSYTHSDFEQVRKRLLKLTGISLSPSKDSMVYSRLARRLRALKLTQFTQYLHYVDTHADEVEHFTNALTTNLTSFFREPHHFQYLTNYLREHQRQHTIWCAAASTGEEPYSIAMAAMEAFERKDPPVNIIATDIDSQVLETASKGVYALKGVEQLSLQRKRRFFFKGTGSNAGNVKIIKELRAMVEFGQLNLLDSSWNIPDKVDMIFCRNVMIYFDKPTQVQVLEKMVRHLRPNGLYFAGHSENFAHVSKVLRPLGQTIYAPTR